MKTINELVSNVLLENGKGEAAFAFQKRLPENNKKVLLSKEIFKAKGQEKGIYYNTPNYKSSLELEVELASINERVDVSEEYHNNLQLCKTALLFGLQEGHFTKEEEEAFGDFQEARISRDFIESMNLSEQDRIRMIGSYQNQAVRYMCYRKDLRVAEEPKGEWVSRAKYILREYKQFEYTNFNIVSNSWIIKKALQHPEFPEEMKDEVASIQAKKDEIVALYESIASGSGLGNSEYAQAYAYARMYVLNYNAEFNRTETDFREKLEPALAAFEMTYNRMPTDAELEDMKQSIGRRRFVGFSSLNTLFPIGKLQLLRFSRTGEMKVVSVAKRPAAAFLVADKPFTEEEKEYLRSLVGKKISFHNQVLEGTSYKLFHGDAHTMKVSEPSPRIQDVEGYGFTTQERNDLMNTKFLQGPSLWTQARQEGVVTLVTIYKQKVKLWMSEFESVGG